MNSAKFLMDCLPKTQLNDRIFSDTCPVAKKYIFEKYVKS